MSPLYSDHAVTLAQQLCAPPQSSLCCPMESTASHVLKQFIPAGGNTRPKMSMCELWIWGIIGARGFRNVQSLKVNKRTVSNKVNHWQPLGSMWSTQSVLYFSSIAHTNVYSWTGLECILIQAGDMLIWTVTVSRWITTSSLCAGCATLPGHCHSPPPVYWEEYIGARGVDIHSGSLERDCHASTPGTALFCH